MILLLSLCLLSLTALSESEYVDTYLWSPTWIHLGQGYCQNQNGGHPQMYLGQKASLQACKIACLDVQETYNTCYGINWDEENKACIVYVLVKQVIPGLTQDVGGRTGSFGKHDELTSTTSDGESLECHSVSVVESCAWDVTDGEKIFSPMWFMTYGLVETNWPFFLESLTNMNNIKCRRACCKRSKCSSYELDKNTKKCVMFQLPLEEGSFDDQRISLPGYKLAFKVEESAVGGQVFYEGTWTDLGTGYCTTEGGNHPYIFRSTHSLTIDECKHECLMVNALQSCAGIGVGPLDLCLLYVRYAVPIEGFMPLSGDDADWSRDDVFTKATGDEGVQCHGVTWNALKCIEDSHCATGNQCYRLGDNDAVCMTVGLLPADSSECSTDADCSSNVCARTSDSAICMPDRCEFDEIDDQRIFSPGWFFQYMGMERSWPFYLAGPKVLNREQCKDLCCDSPQCTTYEVTANGECVLFKLSLSEGSEFDDRIVHIGGEIGFKNADAEIETAVGKSAYDATWINVGEGGCQSLDGNHPTLLKSDMTSLEGCKALCQDLHPTHLCYGIEYTEDGGACGIYTFAAAPNNGLQLVAKRLQWGRGDEIQTAVDIDGSGATCYKVDYTHTCTWDRLVDQKIFSMLWWLSPAGPVAEEWEFFLDSADNVNELQCRDACCSNELCTAYEISELGKCLLFQPNLEKNSPWDHRIQLQGFNIGFKTSGAEGSVGRIGMGKKTFENRVGSSSVGSKSFVSSSKHSNFIPSASDCIAFIAGVSLAGLVMLVANYRKRISSAVDTSYLITEEV